MHCHFASTDSAVRELSWLREAARLSKIGHDVCVGSPRARSGITHNFGGRSPFIGLEEKVETNRDSARSLPPINTSQVSRKLAAPNEMVTMNECRLIYLASVRSLTESAC